MALPRHISRWMASPRRRAQCFLCGGSTQASGMYRCTSCSSLCAAARPGLLRLLTLLATNEAACAKSVLGCVIASLISCCVLPLREYAYLQSLCCIGFPGRRRVRRVSCLHASGADCRAAGPAAAVAAGRGGKVVWTRACPAVLQGCASSNAAGCATDALSWPSRSTRRQWLVRVLDEPSAAATCAALGEGEPGRDGSGVRALAACLLTGCTGPPLFLGEHPHAYCNCRAF